MRARKLIATGVVVAAVTAFGAASAIAQSSNEVTFTVNAAPASALSLSNGDAGVNLSAADFSLTGASVTGTLPTTTVTDQRGEIAGAWTVEVSADGDFTNSLDGDVTVPASAARVYLDAATLTELTDDLLGGAETGMTIVSAELNVGTNNLGAPYTLIEGTSLLGNGSIEYTPTVDVAVPAGTPAGEYSTTVVQTVS